MLSYSCSPDEGTPSPAAITAAEDVDFELVLVTTSLCGSGHRGGLRRATGGGWSNRPWKARHDTRDVHPDGVPEVDEVWMALPRIAVCLAMLTICQAVRLEGQEPGGDRKLVGQGSKPHARFTGFELTESSRTQDYRDHIKVTQESILEARKRILGADYLDYPVTLSSMINLASRGSAWELQEQILETQRQIVGSGYLDTFPLNRNMKENLGLGPSRELTEQILGTRMQVFGPDHPSTLTSMSELGAALGALGEHGFALELHEQVLEGRERILGSEHPSTLTSMNNLAVTLFALGDHDGSREVLMKLMEVHTQAIGEAHPNMLTFINNLALALSKQGDIDVARDLSEQVLKTRRRILGAAHPDTLASMNNLAAILQCQGELDSARRLQAEVLESQRRSLGLAHPDTLNSMNNLAVILRDQGDLVGAQSLFEQALSSLRDLWVDRVQEVTALMGLGALHRKVQRLDIAADYFRQALGALEMQISRLGGTHDLKAAYRARRVRIYREAIELFADMGLQQESLEILERYRARSFLDMLRERDLIFIEISEDLERARRAIAARYDQRFFDLVSASGRDEVEAIAAELKKLRRKRDGLEVRIRRAAPRLAALQNPRPLDITGIRESLDPGTVMLSYSVGEHRTRLFIVTRDELHVEPLEIGEERLRRDIELFRDRIQQARPGTSFADGYFTLGKRLYAMLIEPAAAFVEASDRLLIVPDGPLHILPFAALIRDAPTGGPGGNQDWQFLVEWKPIHSVLSATVYAELKRSRRPSGQSLGDPAPYQLVAFGDPAYPGVDREQRRGIGDLRLRAAVGRGYLDDLTRLEHSRREVQRIGQLYPETAARAFLDEAATEDQAKAIGRDARILHFAVHGVLDHRAPLDSFLALSIPESFGEGQDNGLLQAWEIFERVRLDADLVVMSACDSALGQELRGEGLIGLTRAFQYAGARSVAATLWSVADEATAELMVGFHRHLQAGKPKDQALQAAQLELIRSPIQIEKLGGESIDRDFSAPVFWAAFQIIGDWQ